MSRLFYKLYAIVFARALFYKMNVILFRLSIRGLGVLNYYNDKLSGEKFFLNKALKNKNHKKIIIDIGANVGNYTINVNNINNNTEIHAIEPMPATYKKLCENLDGIQGVKTYNIAIGKQSEKLTIYDYDDQNSEHASLYKEVITELHESKNISEYRVDVISLDEFCKMNNIENIDILKIDTEGYEYNILSGARKMLTEKRIGIIHFEFNEMNVVSRIFFRDFIYLLENYKLYRLLPKGFLPLNKYTPILYELFAYQNIIAIRNDMEL